MSIGSQGRFVSPFDRRQTDGYATFAADNLWVRRLPVEIVVGAVLCVARDAVAEQKREGAELAAEVGQDA